ncbi:MAG: thioesterase [Bacilli bacterium]|jgi:acyl-CoA thioesterase FadM|nr:thioesterase [Bacilli bacterium]
MSDATSAQPILRYPLSFKLEKTDAQGNPWLSDILLSFQQAATAHVTLFGLGDSYFRVLRRRAFVLCREKLIFLAKMVTGKLYTLFTYPLEPGKLEMYREAYVLDDQGKEVLRLHSLWVLIDFDSRRLALTTEAKAKQDSYFQGQVLSPLFTERLEKLDLPSTAGLPYQDHIVTADDLDSNNHMNNTVYLRLVQEEGLTQLIRSLEINYEKECRLGETLRIFRKDQPGSSVFMGYKSDQSLSFAVRFDY